MTQDEAKHLRTCSKPQRRAVNSRRLPLPSRLPQAVWWPETLWVLSLTSMNYLDASPCGTPAHTCKRNLWNTLDNDKLHHQPSYPLHQNGHPRQPSEKGKKNFTRPTCRQQTKLAIHSKSFSYGKLQASCVTLLQANTKDSLLRRERKWQSLSTCVRTCMTEKEAQ